MNELLWLKSLQVQRFILRWRRRAGHRDGGGRVPRGELARPGGPVRGGHRVRAAGDEPAAAVQRISDADEQGEQNIMVLIKGHDITFTFTLRGGSCWFLQHSAIFLK